MQRPMCEYCKQGLVQHPDQDKGLYCPKHPWNEVDDEPQEKTAKSTLLHKLPLAHYYEWESVAGMCG